MAYYAESEIRQKIAAIDAAVETVLSGGQTYSLADGQGTISVTRSSLPALRAERDYWLAELEDLQAPGVVSFSVRR